MKKMFYSMFALAAMAMTSTSCSDEIESGALNSNEAAVSFNLQLENAVGSRAIGDGNTATELHYAVYKAKDGEIGTEIPALRGSNGYMGTKTISGHQATVELTLVKGQTYNFLFWAQAPNGEDYYDINFAEGKITIKYDNDKKDANDEKRDAFCKVHKNVKITGPIEETIVLKRPFAQVNVGTKIGSLEEARKAAVWIKQSDITIKNVANKLNAYSGAVEGDVEVTFAQANIPEQSKYNTDGELKDVDQKNYEYLAMNYILVNDTQKDAETDKNGVEGDTKSTVNATFRIYGSQESENGALDATPINTFDIPNIPVQRNWRTNIIGDIMNETVTFNIVIDPKFDNDHNYYTEKELAYAFASGGEISLDKDVVLTDPLILDANEDGSEKVVTINLNGHTIKAPLFTENNGTFSKGSTDSYPFIVNKGTLNIKGEGSIEAQACRYSMAVWANGGTVNIYGGTYRNAGEGSDLIYAKNGGVVNIYGGTFEACEKQPGTQGTLEKHSALNLHGSNPGTITVYGGRFFEFNPADNKSENPKVNFVADGYAVIKHAQTEGDPAVPTGKYYYEVVEYNEVFQGENVTMLSDVKADETIVLAAGQNLDGDGKTIEMVKSDAQYAIQSAGGIIRNIIIEGYNTRNENSKVTRGIFIANPQENVTIEDVHVSGVAYPLNTGTKSKVANLELTVKNSTLIGWSSWEGGFASASFEGCIFGVGTYFDEATIAENPNWNGLARPYIATTFEGCEFNEGFVLDAFFKVNEGKANEKTYQPVITLKNCTYNGQAITAATLASLVEEGDPIDQITIE